MRIIIFLILLPSLTFLSCKGPKEREKETKEYAIIEDDDGILVESFDITNTDENKYNHNNIVYRVGNRFTYKFEHITPQGEIQYFKIIDGGDNWNFVNIEEADSTTIKTVIIEVANGNPMSDHIPDYNQTVLIYRNPVQTKIYSMSGAIENEENVWIHPPRDNYFRILEINPFPYIKAPYNIGTKWTWQLTIGEFWSDPRWKLWQGQIENNYTYKITDKKRIKTALGELECYIIESIAKSRIGETKLTSYFNTELGFVRLNYTNIDGSKTNLELTQHF